MTETEFVPPSYGPATAQAVLDLIRVHPEQHDQGYWQGDCGTSHCVGGWAIFAHTRNHNTTTAVGPDEWYVTVAAKYLGLSNDSDDVDKLFYQTDNEQALEALGYIARGEEIDWDAIGVYDEYDEDRG